MTTVNYSIEINAPAARVYKNMLDKTGYEEWTSPFSPTSSFEGNWEKGSKMLFTAINKEGKKEGMISELAENIPNKFVSICHKGMLSGGKEITEGPEVDPWVNAMENYTFEENNGVTNVTVHLDVEDKYKEHFDQMWVKSWIF